MSEIPYEPDFAHMVSSALISGDRQMARFLLAAGAFGDSLNHAYKSDFEPMARELLYRFDSSNELNIKAHLLKRYSEDTDGSFRSSLVANGIFSRFVEEAWKNYEAARDSLNDVLLSWEDDPLPGGVVVDPDVRRLEEYLGDSLSFERFDLYEKDEYDLRNIVIEDQFYARTLTVNYRRILFDVVALNRKKGGHTISPGGSTGEHKSPRDYLTRRSIRKDTNETTSRASGPMKKLSWPVVS
jgi:hypothetical protein